MRPVDQHEDAILGAMRQVALAGGPLTEADRASLLAAGRYLLRRPDVTDCAALPAVTPADLATTIKDKELKVEAVKYLTVMALVDGSLDKKKVARVLEYSRALDVEDDHLTEIVEAASGHLAWSLADMTRQNMASITGRPWPRNRDAMPWFLPCADGRAEPALAARYEALGKLPDDTFGKALWAARRCGPSTRRTDTSFPASPLPSTSDSAHPTIRRT